MTVIRIPSECVSLFTMRMAEVYSKMFVMMRDKRDVERVSCDLSATLIYDNVRLQ